MKPNTDLINLLANFLQFYNTSLLQEDASNNDLMKELQHQNETYLKAIIEKLDNIISLLKVGERVFYDKGEKIDALTYLEKKIDAGRNS